MKKIFSTLFIILLFQTSSLPQLLTWTPNFPLDSDSITVVFNAALGNQGLMGYTGDVYAHTGVLTNLSSGGGDWRYVKTNWGVNTPETKLTRIGTDLYEFKIKPSVRSFYSVPVNESITNIAFVFRSATAPYLEGKTADNSDIFLPLATAGLNVAIINPTEFPQIKQVGESLQVQAVSANSTNLALYLDGSLITQTAGTTVSTSIQFMSIGKKWVKAIATSSSGSTARDSFYVVVRPSVTVQDLPANVKDGINYTSPVTSTLVIYAPDKEFAYVIGDFNNWEVDPNFYMKRTSDGKRYWLEMSGLTPAYEYAFQYLINGNLRVADPYADKILDPWNDQYINSQVYPNLKAYPTGKTTNIVSVLETAQAQFQWQVTNFQKPSKTNLVIYELLLRDFTSSHSYKSLKDTLNYLKTLGVNAIELMPFTDFEGNESWGYNPMFMFAPDKYYGPKNELKKFIDACHQNGIAVILDAVLNHQFGNSSLVKMYWDAANNRPAANSPWFNQTPRHPFNVGYDFNHESLATQYFLDRFNEYWIKEFKIDGFRYDLSKGFTQTYSGSDVGLWGQYDQSRINLLKRMADKIWLTDPTAYVILEHFAANSEEIVLSNYGMLLWGNMNYNYNEATMGWLSNSDFSGVSHKNRGWSNPHLIGYMESHDEERLMYKNLQYGNSSGSYNIKNLNTALNRMKLAAGFFFTIPGPKMFWQFGELGYDFSIFYPCGNDACKTGNKPIRWDYYSNPQRNTVYKVYKALINLKTNYDVFSTNDFNMQLNGATKRIWLNHSSMNVLVLGNFDVVSQSITPSFQNTGKWYEFFSGDSITVSDPNAQFTLQAGELRIYSTQKFPTPEPNILTENDEESYTTLPDEFALNQNYPNPFNPSTTISYSIPVANFVTLKIYNTLGEVVATLVNNEWKEAGYHNYQLSIINYQLPSGVYFYQLRVGDFVATKKMVLMR